MDPSNWKQATDVINLTFLQLVRDIIIEWYEQTGSWPTPSQIRSKLQSPGL